MTKRILITGANGMVGKNVCEHAAASNFELLTPSRAEMNLLNRQAVIDYLADTMPDFVIHCAGIVGGIQANIREPVKFLLANFDMGRNIVMAAKEVGISQLINLGSSCMYPRTGHNPLKEETILHGELEPTNEGYALAKVAVQKLCEYVSREVPKCDYKTLIPCNLYGRHDKFDPMHSHMVPAIIHKLHQAKIYGHADVEIWGDGNARREFMYAADLADCIWRAVDHFEDLPAIMNVGLGEDWSVNDYYHICAKVIGYTGSYTHDLSKPVGMTQKLVCTQKQREWGWRPRYTLSSGIELTYKFYLKECYQ